MSTRLYRRPRGIQAAINVTSLTDIALVLLVIFMVTATFLGIEEGVDVKLPGAASASPREDVGAIMVLVAADGRVFIDLQEVSRNMLVPAFKEKARVGGRKQVVIRGDRDASYEGVFEVMDAARMSGLPDIALATQPAPTPAASGGG